MKLITIRSQIGEVAERWREQYFDGQWIQCGTADKEAIYKMLCQVDVKTATAEDIAAIIGNGSWVEVPRCDECECACDVVVEIGEPFEMDSHTANVCFECLEKALRLRNA